MDITEVNCREWPEREISELCPAKTQDIEVAVQRDSAGDLRYVLHNSQSDKYVRLSQPLYSVFSKMDGETSLGDLIRQVFQNGDTPELATVLGFLVMLNRNGMVTVQPEEANRLLDSHSSDSHETQLSVLSKLGQKVIRFRISCADADQAVTTLYNCLGRFLFTKPAITTMALVSVLGIVLLAVRVLEAPESLLMLFLVDGSHSLLVPATMIGFFISLILHESAHALTCKHFGRRVRAVGLILYYGCPTFFTDVSDSWMLSRNKRMAVAAAGVAANALAGAICGGLVYFTEGDLLRRFFLVGAAVNILAVFFNLIPFLKLDGYYILSDYLDRPNLREEAISLAIDVKVWKRILSRSNASGVSVGLCAFGLCSLAFGCLMVTFLAISVFALIHENIPKPFNAYFAFGVVTVLISSTISYGIRSLRAGRKVHGCRRMIPD